MTRRELKKLLENKNYRLMERKTENGTSYIEVADDFRTWLISQIKGLDVSYCENGKQHFRHGSVYYYLEEKTIIPTTFETTMPKNITWN